ncbi:MAG: ATP-binding cassette domain-containing protein [Methanosarcinaceae archaeon]|nr:ATP-binding cassette domain-containing protein [Methanosarcinaceae archaeon]
MSILSAKNLVYEYPDGTKAIKDLSIEIERGKKISVVGKNGSGKSTLFSLLNGTLKPKSGEIKLYGEKIGYSQSEIRNLRKNVGIVFQNSDDQIFAPTVYQDIAFGPANLGYSDKQIEEIVQKMLDYFGLNSIKDKPPHHLSGGQKRKVAIAGILAMDPEIIILDEPLSNLDPVGADEIMDILNELNHTGKTIIISTHDVDLAYSWSDTVYLLSDGKISISGNPESVFSQEELIRKSSLKTPVLLEVYKELEKRWLSSCGFLPKNIPELVQTLREIYLFRVKVPKGTKVGDCINVGFLYKEYDPSGVYESVNSKVLLISDDNSAIVEVKKKIMNPGSIYIYDIDNHDSEQLHLIFDKYDINYVAAVGKRSHGLADSENIKVDANYGVIDKSILKSLTGGRCIILTGKGMIEHTYKRIKEYSTESGIKINCKILNTEN